MNTLVHVTFLKVNATWIDFLYHFWIFSILVSNSDLRFPNLYCLLLLLYRQQMLWLNYLVLLTDLMYRANRRPDPSDFVVVRQPVFSKFWYCLSVSHRTVCSVGIIWSNWYHCFQFIQQHLVPHLCYVEKDCCAVTVTFKAFVYVSNYSMYL